MELNAGGRIIVDVEADGTVRVGSPESRDWFGPGAVVGAAGALTEPEMTDGVDALGAFSAVSVTGDPVRCSVRAYPVLEMIVFRAEATSDVDDLSTRAFDQPSLGWPVFTPSERADVEADRRAVAFQHCEFALPSTADAGLDGFFLLPHRPSVAWPLIVDDGRCSLLLAPLDNFHEQTIGVNSGSLRCGWHGDLTSVPAGFTTAFAVIAGDNPRHCLDRWGSLLLERAGTVRPGRWADALASRPSYWTDNGAAYWYRTEPGHDVAGSIVAAVDDLRAEHVPVGAVQLDSWFYPHVDLRPFDTDEWVVPPSALTAWEERDDVLPEGISSLRRRLGDPPLVAHIRHLSSDAAIAAELPVYVDGAYAAPATSEIYERWLDQCLAWGVETFEHDWLVEVFFGVRGLREIPGRARAWQEGIDEAARDRGITLQWCMGTPADFAQTTTLTQVTSVRTCGDHGYIATAGQLWAWFCITNAMARGLGLMPFKDVFRADLDIAGNNGEPEALLSALSTGPVGLGDRAGRMDPDLAMRTCRRDGLLIKPDVPVAAVSASMLANPAFNAALLVAETHTDHAAGRWTYVVSMHCQPSDEPISGEVSLRDVGVSGDVVVWDWRGGTATRSYADSTITLTLGREEWDYRIVAPVVCGGRVAVIGDVSKFVSAGDARVTVTEVDGKLRVVVEGAQETVTITGWATDAPEVTAGALTWDAETGVWSVPVAIGSRGWESFELIPKV